MALASIPFHECWRIVGVLFRTRKLKGVRFTRLLAFATWVVTALLAMAAFAAFSPSDELAVLGASVAPADTPESNDDAMGDTSIGLPPDIGAAAGRQAAFGFSQDMLSLSRPEATTTTAPPPSTTSTTVAPTTTTTTSTTSTTTTTTVAAPPPPPRRTRAPLPPDDVYALVSAYFAPADVEKAVLVAWCESRYDANATHPSSRAAGLFQHLPRFWADRSSNAGLSGADIYDPVANTAVAAWLVYSNGGWKHWNPSKSCWGSGSVVPPPTTTTTTTTTTLPPTTTTVSPTTMPTTPSTTTTTAPPATTTSTTPATTTTSTTPTTTTTTTPSSP